MKSKISLISALLAIGCMQPSSRNLAKVNKAETPSFQVLKASYKKGEITQLCDGAIGKAQSRIDELAQTREKTFDSTMLKFDEILSDFSDESGPLAFMGYVDNDAAIRQEASTCEEKSAQFSVDVFTRKDVYNVLKDSQGRNDDEKRLAQVTLSKFESNGLMLPDDQLAQVKVLMQKLASLETKFSANLNNDESSASFTAEELKGVPEDFLAKLTKDADGKYVVPATEPSYVAVTQYAVNADTRRAVTLSFYNRAAEANTKLLEEAVLLRQSIAKMLGKTTWADFKITNRTAKNADEVWSFLNGLKAKLAKRNTQDLEKLLAMKKETYPAATALDMWDINYYTYQLKKRDYQLDTEKIKEYFPTDLVMAGMFDVYSKLLGVNFVEVKNAAVWNPDVKLYQIRNQSDGQLVAYFYTDFIPRKGKYSHAAAWQLISGRQLKDSYVVPVSAIVANYDAPSGGKPSLMKHDEVTTTFHEFGHIMHQTLTKARYGSLSGTNVAQDFVEAPSQMLESWPFDAQILASLSGHYADHSQKLPKDLLEKLVASRDFNQGYRYTRQLMLATFDMTIHTQSGAVDVTKVYNGLYKDFIGVEPVPGAHFPATFGHMMGGYDAGYYGYLWSEVYAADMYTRFEAGGLTNPEVGAQYRRSILEKGGMMNALDLLKEFLGREPNAEAFYKKLHIDN